eukprot:104302-Rhodomonas_salina.2
MPLPSRPPPLVPVLCGDGSRGGSLGATALPVSMTIPCQRFRSPGSTRRRVSAGRESVREEARRLAADFTWTMCSHVDSPSPDCASYPRDQSYATVYLQSTVNGHARRVTSAMCA